MTAKRLLFALCCLLLFVGVGCKKSIHPQFPEGEMGKDASYCGRLTGFGHHDLRMVVDAEGGFDVSEKVFQVDTAFLHIAQFQLLTPKITVAIKERKINDVIQISLRDTTGNIHQNVAVVITGDYSDEALNLDMQLAVNQVDYNLQYRGKNGDWAALIDGMYYGTFSILGNVFPNDSIRLDWRKERVVSVIAATDLEQTPVYTDEETTVTKEEGYCSIHAITKMEVQSGLFQFEDVPTEIIGTVRDQLFHLEVMMIPPGYSVSIVLVFDGER